MRCVCSRRTSFSQMLKPGAMVSENELAAQLGLSPHAVREALMDMAQYGLVDILPQRGSPNQPD